MNTIERRKSSLVPMKRRSIVSKKKKRENFSRDSEKTRFLLSHLELPVARRNYRETESISVLFSPLNSQTLPYPRRIIVRVNATRKSLPRS